MHLVSWKIFFCLCPGAGSGSLPASFGSRLWEPFLRLLDPGSRLREPSRFLRLYKLRLGAVMDGITGFTFTESILQESPEESADWMKPWLGTRISMSATSEQTEGSGSVLAIQSLTYFLHFGWYNSHSWEYWFICDYFGIKTILNAIKIDLW